MTKEEIVYKIEQIAHNGAFDGINADYVEREAEKLADKIVKLFTIPVVVSTSKCYHENHEWKSDGDGGNLKYCNDCKGYV